MSLGVGKERQHKAAVVALQHAGVVVAFGHQPLQLIVLAGERDGVSLDVGCHKGVHRLAVLVKRDAPAAVVQIQHGVEGVEIRCLCG